MRGMADKTLILKLGLILAAIAVVVCILILVPTKNQKNVSVKIPTAMHDVFYESLIDKSLNLGGHDFRNNPGLLPDSKIYFLKNWGEQIKLFFLWGDSKNLYLADLGQRRLIEFYLMTFSGKKTEAEKSLKNYTKIITKLNSTNLSVDLRDQKTLVHYGTNYALIELLKKSNSTNSISGFNEAQTMTENWWFKLVGFKPANSSEQK